VCEGIDSL